MGSLLFAEQFSDVRFFIENQEIPAHKLVLSARCGSFQDLLRSGNSLIEITDIQIHTFKGF